MRKTENRRGRPPAPALVALRNVRVGRRALKEREAKRARAIDLDAILWLRLTDTALSPGATADEKHAYTHLSRANLDEAWRGLGAEILREWVRRRPGTRPSTWWRLDAPRAPAGAYPGCFFDGKLPAPRLRIGGRGTPAFEVLAYVPTYVLGLPSRWVDDWQIAYYTGKLRGADGTPIGATHAGRKFAAQAFDRDDPPRFESQAAYLKRHGLLLPAEAARCAPRDFKPEKLPPEFWPTPEKEPQL